jgi:hypothetical protein
MLINLGDGKRSSAISNDDTYFPRTSVFGGKSTGSGGARKLHDLALGDRSYGIRDVLNVGIT